MTEWIRSISMAEAIAAHLPKVKGPATQVSDLAKLLKDMPKSQKVLDPNPKP
jgi:hypothetical protein